MVRSTIASLFLPPPMERNTMVTASQSGRRNRPIGPSYKWIALSNTTLGVLMASIDSSIVLISLPAIFNGIHINPLAPGETHYFLWLLLGYMVVTTTLLVTLGRISDMLGRVRMYNLGFLIFAIASILLWLTPGTGNTGAVELIVFRLIQGIGSGFLFANSAAIITDAFPSNQRGLALGINQIAAILGSVIGLILGGILSYFDWRLVFLVSVPVGIVGTIWAYLMLRETATIRQHQHIDWLGNITFAIGLTIFLVGITYGIEPYGGSPMGWGSPLVISMLAGGVILLGLFVWIESRVDDPMFQLKLFKIRAFAAGNTSSFLASIARGGLQFMLIIWLQGIWLPLHGYDYAEAPLWAGIYLLPLLIGFVLIGPLSGWLSDRFGARVFSTTGMVIQAAGFILLTILPANFSYVWFALILFMLGMGQGMFSSPNTSSVMSSLPPEQRGAGSGMRATFQNAGSLASIGIFFSVVIAGLAASLPQTLTKGLTAVGVSVPVASQIAHLPPTSALFAAFLGYNPMENLLPSGVLHSLPLTDQANLLGHSFFPNLISPPFLLGLHGAFYLSATMCVIAAFASALRGKRYVHDTKAPLETPEVEAADGSIEVPTVAPGD
ncbi:MAG TPA: MFS transporter [Ktedonobacteraceae bacterium]|nr:MFS transporter [Ktedonobacteraceae bacterium]